MALTTTAPVMPAAAKPASRIDVQKSADPAFDRDGNKVRDER